MTGATGFIGSRVADRLLQQGSRVRLFVRDAERLTDEVRNAAAVQIELGEMCDRGAVRRAVEGVDRVIHLAATTEGKWEDYYQGTVLGTKYILEAASQARVQRFVHVSSMSVYDYSRVPDGGSIDERSPLETNPALRNDYARAKGMADAYAVEFMQTPDLPMCVVRPGVVYGPGGRPAKITTLINLGNRVCFLIGGGRRQIPLVYVENLVDVLLLLLEHDVTIGKVYNVVDDDAPSEREYLRRLFQLQGAEPLIVPLPRPPFLLAAQLVQSYRDARGQRGSMHLAHGLRRVTANLRFSARALRKDTGWQSRVSFDQGMRLTFS